MNQEFFDALEMIAKEKGIPPQYLVDKISNAIMIAVRKDYPGTEGVHVHMDLRERQCSVSLVKRVVEQLEDPHNEMLLDEAKTYSKYARIGEEVEIPLQTEQFGRIAAQNAKQVIRQGIMDIEREMVMEKMGSKVGCVLSALVDSVDPVSGNAAVFLEGYEAILFKRDQIPNESLEAGDRIKVYVVDIVPNDRKRPLKISRTHRDLVKGLFEMEVPEISDGTVEIKAVAREAGSRSKVAVMSHDENVDPIGACIGSRGIRVNQISQELGGEKIDIILYSEDPATFISAALAPARVVQIDLCEGENSIAFVSVPDGQLSLAIGNRGQNAKLSARLTGYKIDISPESGFYGEDRETRIQAKLERLKKPSDEQQKSLLEVEE